MSQHIFVKKSKIRQLVIQLVKVNQFEKVSKTNAVSYVGLLFSCKITN